MAAREKTKGELNREIAASGQEGKITVRICGKEKGLEVFEHVNFIRVKSRQYNLLIMADYMPVIGEVEGSVFFRTKKEEFSRDHLKGYFMHKKNQFSLMLESEDEEAQEKVKGEVLS